MGITIALTGNPNSGKTTLFNNLTGNLAYVGNWPGVTVEKKEGRVKQFKDVTVVDLPGIYSLSPYSPEERVSRNYIFEQKPDVIVNIVDATNLERNLYLTSQLTELGVPVLIALNMMDLMEKKGERLDVKKLSEITGCEVVQISALKGKDTLEVVKKSQEIAVKSAKNSFIREFSPDFEQIIAQIEKIINGSAPEKTLRFNAIKLFERDSLTNLDLPQIKKDQIENIVREAEKSFDDDAESIVINERYIFIENAVKDCYVLRKTVGETLSDRVDKIVTNRWAAIPIFLAVMFVVYFIAVSTVGGLATDWANDVLFGEWVPWLFKKGLDAVNAAPWLTSLILDGIVAGVGSVLGFLPQLIVLFLLLALLEDVGYLSRIAFILDRIFRKFGLSGKSFIPMMIGTGCSVPGIMASRTVENENDRKITVMTTSFVPCGAKLPVIALIAGALFNGSAVIVFSIYIIGIAAVLVSGVILKKFRALSGEENPFLMELPPYHVPSVRNILLHTWERAKSFVIKAGTVIFVAAIVIWFASNFSWSMKMVAMDESMLASIGKALRYLFVPLGFGEWKATVATFLGLVAKENVVNAFGILYNFEEVAENGEEIWGLLEFTKLSGYSFLLFNMLCAPCFAAIGAIKRELASLKWTLITIGYQTALAYTVSLVVYQAGLLFTGVFTAFTIPAFILLGVLLFMVFRPADKQGHFLGIKIRTKAAK